MDNQTYLTPKEAARQLDISPSGLRRLSGVYCEIHGDLPRDPNTDARLWPEVAVERLKQARGLVEANRFSSIKEALEAIEKGIDLSTEIATPQAHTPADYEILEKKIDQLLELVTFQNKRINELDETVRQLNKKLELETLSIPQRPWWKFW